MFVQSVTAIAPACAATVTYDPTHNGAIKGDVPCHKIGTLLLAEGLALLNGDTISIEGKDAANNVVHELVSGKVVNQATKGIGPAKTLNGIAYFNSGVALASLEPHCKGECVDRKDGSRVHGHITDITQEAVKIVPRSGSEITIPMDAVSGIHSPNVFKFSMRLGDTSSNDKGALAGNARDIVFNPTCSNPLVGHVSKKKIIIISVVTLLVATAIACAVAIPLATRGHHRDTSQQDLANAILLNRQPDVPVTTIPGTPPVTRFPVPVEPEVPFNGPFFFPTPGMIRKLPPAPPIVPIPPRNPRGPFNP